jgi:integrase
MRKSFNRGEDGKDHLIPISKPVYAMLEEMLPWSGPGAGRTAESRIFPGQKTGRPISENTMNNAYRILGYYNDEIVFHGLRTTATTWLNEDGWKSDWIEKQMAHVERDSVRRVYNAAQYLKGRHKMMKAWSKKPEGIKAEASS